uniref:Epg5-like TPR domain-containing protein n=1 Tax=Romanomermis culicivorax TaxID=13658 RepID=A0A915JMG0_ROMCU
DFLSVNPGADNSTFLCELVHNSDPKVWNSAKPYLLTMDSIIEQYFSIEFSLKSILPLFAKFFENYLLHIRQQPKAALFGKIFGEGQLNDFLDRSFYHSFPYLAYASILTEEIGLMKIHGDFYNEMLRFPTTAVEQAWKKVCNKHSLNLNINRLPVSLWLDLVLSQKIHHPVFCCALEKFLRHFFRIFRSPDP